MTAEVQQTTIMYHHRYIHEVCLDATDEIDSYSLYLEFDPGVKHGSQYYVLLMHQVLEV